MKKVAVLAAVAALLAAYLLFVDGGRDRPGSSAPGAHPPLLAELERGSVRRLSIARAANPPFSLERQAAGAEPAWRGWPGGWPAAEAAVDELLTALAFAELERAADTTPAAAGLSSPAVEITLALDGGGAPRTLRFGHPDAGGGGVFVGIGDDPTVQVAPRHLLDLLDRPPEAYRVSEAADATGAGD